MLVVVYLLVSCCNTHMTNLNLRECIYGKKFYLRQKGYRITKDIRNALQLGELQEQNRSTFPANFLSEHLYYTLCLLMV